MKPRHPTSEAKARTAKRAKTEPAQLDQLGIKRGQNGEKGNTVTPQNVSDKKAASH